MRSGGSGGGGCSGGSGAEDVGLQAASARERARGGAATTRCSAQVMAGRVPGNEGEETRGRGGRAGLQRPSRCASPGRAPGPCRQWLGPRLCGELSSASGLGVLQPEGESRWVDSGGPGRGSERRGGQAGSLGVWLSEQFKVTLHIRALRPPLLDPGGGEASGSPPPAPGRQSSPVIGSASQGWDCHGQARA